MNSSLVQRLEASSEALTTRVLDEMYRNPFWDERYGARGRTFAEEDGLRHLSYLEQALIADDPVLMARYARWLQSVLVSRGMCSRHLAENFERLGRAIGDVVLDSAKAVAFLDEAVGALRYEAAAAGALQDVSEALSERAVQVLYDRHPEWGGRERCLDDLRYHLSYLADAMAVKKPALFAAYVSWLTGFLERRQVPAAHLREALTVLSEVVAESRELSADHRRAAEDVLRAGLAQTEKAA